MKFNKTASNYSIYIILAFLVFVSGCKKVDLHTESVNFSKEDIAKVRENVGRQQQLAGGTVEVFPRNHKTQTTWVDANRKPVTKAEMQQSNFTSVCNYDLPSSCDLISYSRVFQCAGSGLGGPGYLIQFKYRIVWNNNVKVYPTGSTTSGFLDIFDASSNLVQSITLDGPSEVLIEDMGPNGSGEEIFDVTFLTTDYTNDLVTSSYINSGTYTVKISAMFVTDCKYGGSPYSLFSLPVTTYGFSGASGNNPCERYEKAWIDISTPNTLAIVGYDALALSCGYGLSFIRPDVQEVQYSLDGGQTWLSPSNQTAAGLGIDNTRFIRKDDVATAGPLSGTYNVAWRYRNWKYNTFSSLYPVPTTANSCFSIGDPTSQGSGTPNASNWAVEYLGPVTF